MPSAISRPSEPVETTSMSIDLSFLPSRMIEPLPKLRSIWESAASRAFVLSMDDPSTRRSAAAPALMIRAPYGRDSEGQQRSGPCPAMLRQHCTRSVLCSQYVLFGGVCTDPFPSSWSLLKISRVPFVLVTTSYPRHFLYACMLAAGRARRANTVGRRPQFNAL